MVAPAAEKTSVAVVGAGWAGLAAAIEASRRGHAVTLIEMAPQVGGRARAVASNGLALDNGQHIMIGAYVETLKLMRAVGVDVDATCRRLPLALAYPDGAGFRLGNGPPLPAFLRAVWRRHDWSVVERAALVAAATGWAMRRFRCDPRWTVGTLTEFLPARVRRELIDPLCIAALNTPAADASAAVFLRVLADALFAGRGSADLLLSRVDLTELFPRPAVRWLERAGAALRLARRVDRLVRDGTRWRVDGEAFDQVILACTPGESARLTRSIAPDWSRRAAALRYEPIVTVYLRCPGLRLAAPLLALRDDAESPAQFVLDRGQLGGPSGLLAFVVSGAQRWVDRGTPVVEAAVQRQALAALGATPTQTVTLTEKRATFRCTPALLRPAQRIAPGLQAAGDHVDGPYPATLEGAVRSGLAAAAGFG